MLYNMPLYRPPSEANSLIIQATLGCSHNNCSFCSMYKDKKFTIKSLDQIKKEILEFSESYPYTTRIFIADGDALIIPMKDLKEILISINKSFKNIERVTMYASPKSIQLKSLDELKELHSLGLKMVYMGIESGSDKVLLDIHKGATRQELIDAALKIKESNIKLSATVIAGISGLEYSKNHAIETGSLISIIKPDFLGVLSLMVERNTEIYYKVKDGTFKTLSNIEILNEIKLLLQNIDTDKPIVFRSNHASNYVSLKGTLPLEKSRLIEDINWCLNNNYLKNETSRRL
ncbi:MAG: radical SAM protein [Romboutsia sp.]|uniref:radical SAM protein n=1 Tax=Romboutsia sp. TaxID=1965302 RepID=UPI003F37036E